MGRTIWLIPVGAIAGCVAVLTIFAVSGPEDPLPATAIGSIEPDAGELARGEPVPAPDAFAASLNAHREAAATTSITALERMIGELAAAPPSPRRDAELHSLLAQFASFNPSAAAQLARELRLGEQAMVTVFQTWAVLNADEALFEVGALQPPATRRAVALAMLEVFGADEAGIEQIADAFPTVEATSFRIDAISQLARHNLEAAVAVADGIEVSATQTIAQQRIAEVMAGIDPHRALEYAETITIPIQRQRFMDKLLDSWAKLDPRGMFAYMETADLTQMAVSANSFRALATASPEQLLALAEKFAPAQRVQAQTAALQALAALDPVSAYQRVSSLPASADRDNFIGNIAQSYARDNPEAALAWVGSLEPRSPAAFNAVLSTIAADDPMRVTDAVIAEILDPIAANRAEMPSLMALLIPAMQNGAPEIAQIADRLSSHGDPRVRMQLSQILQMWPQRDPEGAMAWVMRNPANLTSATAAQFAQLLANQNPALARQSLARIPENLRGQWIQGAASGMARSDFDGALAWIETFRDDPAYGGALEAALMSGAMSRPEVVVDYLDQVSPETRSQVGSLAATAWASRDPAAAADWLSSMPAAEQSTLGGAAGSIAQQWAQRDSGAAERWVLGLSSSASRDAGLTGLIQASAGRGSIDGQLFEQFSSDQARSNAVMSSMFALGRSDPDLAHRLIDEHIADPAQRTQAESMLEAASRTTSGFALPAGIGLPSGATIRAGSANVCITNVNGNAVAMPC